MYFIIWVYEDDPIRVEETNTLSKTYTHRCEERSEFILFVIASLTASAVRLAIYFLNRLPRALHRRARGNDRGFEIATPAFGGLAMTKRAKGEIATASRREASQ